MSKIELKDLSASEQQELMAELATKEKERKARVKEDKTTYKELSSDFVKENIEKCVNVRGLMARVIDELFADFTNILELKVCAYGDKVKKFSSHTSTLADGSASITIGWNSIITFDGTETIGIEKIKTFMSSLSEGDERMEKLNEIINIFLRKNKKTGQLNPSKIIELNAMRERLNSVEFNDGLDIIIESQIVTRTTMYASGYQMVEKDGKPSKLEFRFTI